MHLGVGKATQVAITQVIAQQDDEIRFLRGRSPAAPQKEEAESAKQQGQG
jgi:hypothetical protein